MKKYFTFFAFLVSSAAFGQLTATDFTVNDCAGTAHHLFAELDAGKIVVVSFVEPCAACIAPSLAAQSTVQGYATSNPGKVVFYISDDQANTDCTSLTGWAATNGMSTVPTFSDPSFKETDYGVLAMPKIAVLAGTSHQLVFVQNNALNTTNLQTAINTALGVTNAIVKVRGEGMDIALYPNPTKDMLSVGYSLQQPSDVSVDVYNLIGNKVISVFKGNQLSGNNSIKLNLTNNIPNGIYFLKLNAGASSASIRFTVDK